MGGHPALGLGSPGCPSSSPVGVLPLAEVAQAEGSISPGGPHTPQAPCSLPTREMQLFSWKSRLEQHFPLQTKAGRSVSCVRSGLGSGFTGDRGVGSLSSECGNSSVFQSLLSGALSLTSFSEGGCIVGLLQVGGHNPRLCLKGAQQRCVCGSVGRTCDSLCCGMNERGQRNHRSLPCGAPGTGRTLFLALSTCSALVPVSPQLQIGRSRAVSASSVHSTTWLCGTWI